MNKSDHQYTFILKTIQNIFKGECLPQFDGDQKELIRIIHLHHLAPRAYRLCSEEQVKSKFQNAYFQALQSEKSFLDLANVSQELLKEFDPVFLKGPILAKRWYEHTTDRIYHDLDLLFDTRFRDEIESILNKNNFKRISHEETFYANEKKTEFAYMGNRDLMLECHFQLGYERFSIEPKTKAFENYQVLMESDELLYLIFHAGVQHRFQRLNWLLDIYQLSQTVKYSSIDKRIPTIDPAIELSKRLIDSILNLNTKDELLKSIIFGSELSIWEVAKLRMNLQGGLGGFIKYASHRFIAKQKTRLR